MSSCNRNSDAGNSNESSTSQNDSNNENNRTNKRSISDTLDKIPKKKFKENDISSLLNLQLEISESLISLTKSVTDLLENVTDIGKKLADYSPKITDFRSKLSSLCTDLSGQNNNTDQQERQNERNEKVNEVTTRDRKHKLPPKSAIKSMPAQKEVKVSGWDEFIEDNLLSDKQPTNKISFDKYIEKPKGTSEYVYKALLIYCQEHHIDPYKLQLKIILDVFKIIGKRQKIKLLQKYKEIIEGILDCKGFDKKKLQDLYEGFEVNK